ncbi:MAG TPA: metal-dependent hydrolase [Humisphaera sp.]
MDAATHLMSGLVLAGPLWAGSPLTAAALVLGTVLPDVDALARVFGKRAFVRAHQTVTHGLPFIAVVTLAVWWTLPEWTRHERYVAAALAGGMLLHVAMDATNTLGVALLSPLSWRRWAAEWVFFIDAAVLAASAAATVAVVGRPTSAEPVAAAYAGFLAAYWAAKAWLRWRAGRLAPPGTASLVPSAWRPWEYLGYRRLGDDAAETFWLNALTGRAADERAWAVLDARFAAALAAVPEFRLMRALSAGYHATDAREVPATDGSTATRVTCRDLRTRNFGGRFGRLDLTVAADGTVREVVFDV